MEEETSHVDDHNVEQLTTNQIKQKAQVSFLIYSIYCTYVMNVIDNNFQNI